PYAFLGCAKRTGPNLGRRRADMLGPRKYGRDVAGRRARSARGRHRKSGRDDRDYGWTVVRPGALELRFTLYDWRRGITLNRLLKVTESNCNDTNPQSTIEWSISVFNIGVEYWRHRAHACTARTT